MNDINKAMADIVKSRVRWVEDATKAQVEISAVSKSINALVRLLGDKVSIGSSGDRLSITVKTSDIKRDVEPLLESIQDVTGGEFNRSDDSMVQYGVAQREFSMSKPPICVIADASGNGDADNCRMVKVGEKVVPVFELRCEGDAA